MTRFSNESCLMMTTGFEPVFIEYWCSNNWAMPSLENSPKNQMTGSALLIPLKLSLYRKGVCLSLHLPKKSDPFIFLFSSQALPHKKTIRKFAFLMVNFFLPPTVCLVKGCSSTNGTVTTDCVLTGNALLIGWWIVTVQVTGWQLVLANVLSVSCRVGIAAFGLSN